VARALDAARAAEPDKPKAPADVFIQWKGTDACLDFHCYACGTFAHFDGDFAYHLKCPTCGTVYDTPDVLPLQRTAVPAGQHIDPQEPTEPEEGALGWEAGPAKEVRFPNWADILKPAALRARGEEPGR
jgi:hypothetical protein